MIRPSGTDPFSDHSLLDDANPVVGDVAQARRARRRRSPATTIPTIQNHAPRQICQGGQKRYRSGRNRRRQPRCHVLNQQRAHGETPLANERDEAAHIGTTRDEIQPLAIAPTIRAPGVRSVPPNFRSIRRPREILVKIDPASELSRSADSGASFCDSNAFVKASVVLLPLGLVTHFRTELLLAGGAHGMSSNWTAGSRSTRCARCHRDRRVSWRRGIPSPAGKSLAAAVVLTHRERTLIEFGDPFCFSCSRTQKCRMRTTP